MNIKITPKTVHNFTRIVGVKYPRELKLALSNKLLHRLSYQLNVFKANGNTRDVVKRLLVKSTTPLDKQFSLFLTIFNALSAPNQAKFKAGFRANAAATIKTLRRKVRQVPPPRPPLTGAHLPSLVMTNQALKPLVALMAFEALGKGGLALGAGVTVSSTGVISIDASSVAANAIIGPSARQTASAWTSATAAESATILRLLGILVSL
jgi:hypothetical protein